MNILIILGASILFVGVILAWAVSRAPLGYEDEDAFHYGSKRTPPWKPHRKPVQAKQLHHV